MTAAAIILAMQYCQYSIVYSSQSMAAIIQYFLKSVAAILQQWQ